MLKKPLLSLFLIGPVLLWGQADHLLFQRIVITPTNAEMVALVNPTATMVDLSNYYLTDAVKASSGKYYYNLPEYQFPNFQSFWSASLSDFIARFPTGTQLPPGDTLVLSMHTDSLFNLYYGKHPDLALFEDMENATDSLVTISVGPNFFNLDLLGNNAEVLILFKWDGSASTVQDIDYFLWGDTTHAVDKSGISGYNIDTPVAQQVFLPAHGNDSTYVRVDLTEIGETSSGGNGITGHDETSEDLVAAWEVVFHPEIVYGCTDPTAPNYNPLATRDDGSCLASPDELTPFVEIIAGLHDGQTVIIQGLLVDYFDVTVYNGPHSITLEDNEGYRLEVTVWPDDWDIPNSPQAFLLEPPFERIVIQATGVVDEYEGAKQIGVTGFDDFDIVLIFGCQDLTAINDNGDCIYPGDFTKAKISPEPYVLIPTMGERLNYEFSYPANSRVIIRVFDLSGRFVTSLQDKYYAEAATTKRISSWSAWDGRDHLGQIVSPGTYFMHIEATDFQSGKTTTDTAPVVIGVKF